MSTVRARKLSRLPGLLLPAGWLLAAGGYLGPWIAHRTAALTLAGPDMAEFAKFLPGAQDGSLPVIRQLFYLPIVAVALGVALLVGARVLRYSWPVRGLAVLLSIPLSAQLLPPAWSAASLLTPEFRLQPIALAVCWLALASFWLLARLPLRLTAFAAGSLALLGCVLVAWQYLVVKPAIDTLYGQAPAIGWGLVACLAGLLLAAAASLALALARFASHR